MEFIPSWLAAALRCQQGADGSATNGQHSINTVLGAAKSHWAASGHHHHPTASRARRRKTAWFRHDPTVTIGRLTVASSSGHLLPISRQLRRPSKAAQAGPVVLTESRSRPTSRGSPPALQSAVRLRYALLSPVVAAAACRLQGGRRYLDMIRHAVL